ncbi:UvrD-helicase domain-containing protein [Luteimonas sp. MC1572]|uniref:UvrD-helicase domain-containing protein n=1 Tax=Luteimonas sp. MC1572 TaxID=2799325 RepID=UPI0018F0BC4C|nr:UvrD-helicase domain-containing protein [Luteimonas sp. MC1572]MBJ6981678.1 UvrD-helicase domain-containing protein [Luteimonas sp. MC1572]QQO02970.1 UvrD-helicase domain-containing protein [Luteimonas sp. MC1572]
MSVIELESPTIAGSWLDLSLDEAGRSLIEASAGTGKTWTIAVLYLRLLLQHELSPRQIVVATFTEASGQELRERIRLRVRDAARWSDLAARGEAPEGADAALDWLRKRWESVSTPDADSKRLQLALSELDSAPIGTLHSLCQRILREYPFETGSQFEQGELSSGKDLLAECARDLIRCETASDGEEGELPSLGALERELAVLLRPGVSVPLLVADEIRAALPADAADRIEAFASDTSMYPLTASAGVPEKKLHNALVGLANWCRDAGVVISPTWLDYLKKPQNHLNPDAWERLQHSPELEMVFRALDAYQAPGDVAESRLLAKRQAMARRVWDQRLAARNELTFDSLLTRTHDAVTRNPSLARQLQEAWPVALIDEFQDTDALQYGTLDTIYRNDEGSLRGRLVMIGDPKQAIYSFRGGDIDTYRRAAASVTDRLVLDTNYRSDKALVEGFNRLYALAGRGLSSRDAHDIRYSDVKPGQALNRYLVDAKPSRQPLALHYLSECPGDAPTRKQLALKACANQIAQMLASDSHQVESTQLKPGDIAVLLPTHDAVADLRDFMNELGVPSVGAGRSSVFAGGWAQEVQLILHAVQHPHSTAAIHAALATRLGGMDFGGLQALRAEPAAQARVSKQFETLREIWAGAGVLAVVGTVLTAAASRLLACNDGERAMTDVRHLGELLQGAEEEMHGASQLLAWLSDQRLEARSSTEAEESQLRMESDARRVKLMTLHASKGLEFPVVFLPLMWAHGGRDNEIALLPDQGGGRKVGFGEEATRKFQQAAQDERFRVLYVALTRARHACHVYALPPARRKDGSTPKPAAGSERSALDVTITRLMRATNNGQDLATTAVGWSEGWPWTAPPRLAFDESDKCPRKARPMPKRAPVHERLHSFSSLSQGRHPVREEQAAADEDAEVLVEVDTEALPQASQESPSAPASTDPSAADKVLKQLAWIRGAEFGNALHQVFEDRRIGAAMADQHPLIDSALRQHGVRISEIPQTRQGAAPEEPTRAEVVARIAERVQAALDADLGDGIRLGAMPARALRAEMAFHYPVDGVRVASLRRLCAAHQIAFPNNATHRLYGLMHGKIDLVFEHGGRFHVLDYKGNQVGGRESGGTLADYDRPSLDNVMRQHCYELQALFYTVAVERLLRQRVPGYQREQHLGDTIYLFVRAAGLAPGAGVWRHRFSDPLLDAADAILAGRAGVEQEAQALEGMEA